MNGWQAILVALIAAAPPSAIAWLAWKQSKVNHVTMNSRLDSLLQITRRAARAKGRLEGKAEQKKLSGE